MDHSIKYTHIPELEERSLYFDHVRIRHHEQITLHEQNTWELAYIVRGSGTRIIGDTIEPFLCSEVILVPPNVAHCWSFDDLDLDQDGTIENICVTFSDQLLERCKSTFPELKASIQKFQSTNEALSFRGRTLQRLQQILLAMVDEDELERLSSLIRLLLVIASASDSISVGKTLTVDKKNRRLQKIVLYMMNNYQHTLTIDEMAQLVELDKSTFCVFFKKMTGKTFFSYLTEFRIEASCQMLLKTHMTISEVCFASGFRDVPYYNRTFKRMKRLTPTQYRANVVVV